MTLWKEEEMGKKSASVKVRRAGIDILNTPLSNLRGGAYYSTTLGLLNKMGVKKTGHLVALSEERLGKLLRSGDLGHHNVNFNEKDENRVYEVLDHVKFLLSDQPDGPIRLRHELQTLAEEAKFWNVDEPHDLPAAFVTMVLTDSYAFKLSTLQALWGFDGSIADLVREIRRTFKEGTGFPGLRVEVQRQIMALFHYIS